MLITQQSQWSCIYCSVTKEFISITKIYLKNYESDNPESYLNKTSEWVEKKSIKKWKRKFRKFKLQIDPIFQFYNSITGEENQIHWYTKAEVILTSDNFKVTMKLWERVVEARLRQEDRRPTIWVHATEKHHGRHLRVEDDDGEVEGRSERAALRVHWSRESVWQSTQRRTVGVYVSSWSPGVLCWVHPRRWSDKNQWEVRRG